MTQQPPQGWVPPTTWAPPEPPRPTAPPADGSRSRAWLVLAGMAALLMIYLCIITYWLSIHTTDRFEQVAPETTVAAHYGDYTLLELRRVRSLPGSDGDDGGSEQGEAYVLATLRLVARDPETIASACTIDLLGPNGRVWDYDYQSALDPQTEDADYCDAVRVGQPATVTVGFIIPATDVDRIHGVVISGYNGSKDLVLTPPE